LPYKNKEDIKKWREVYYKEHKERLSKQAHQKYLESKVPCPQCGRLKKRESKICLRCLSQNNIGKHFKKKKLKPKIKYTCEICRKVREVYPSAIKYRKVRFCSRNCKGISTVIHSIKGNTSIEIAIEKELQKRNVKYLKQIAFPIAHTVVDFLLPETNTIIYCDGDYWHNRPETKARDRNQDFILTFYGYKVFRFWEKDIKKSAKKCIEKILKERGD